MWINSFWSYHNESVGTLFSLLCRCSRWEWGLRDGVGVCYLPASRWLRLLLSRRMGAASIFQLSLSGNPLNWIFTKPMFSVGVRPVKPTFLLLVPTGRKVFPHSYTPFVCLVKQWDSDWLCDCPQNRRLCS